MVPFARFNMAAQELTDTEMKRYRVHLLRGNLRPSAGNADSPSSEFKFAPFLSVWFRFLFFALGCDVPIANVARGSFLLMFAM